jgi:hypothetical protein
MRRTVIVIVSVSVVMFLLVCCTLLGLFLDGYYLPGKPCRPFAYPNLVRTTNAFSITTQDSIETVLQFYDQNLNIKPIMEADTGDWKIEELENSRFLYSCYSVDINGLTTESGCIYVTVEGLFTRIEGELNRSEGSNIQCIRH